MIMAEISWPNFTKKSAISLIDYSISRVVNEIGQFSITVDIRDLEYIGIDNPINKWVIIDGIGDFTPFIGQVRDYNISVGDFSVELSGGSIESILSDRIISPITTSARPSGSIASQILRSTTAGDNLPITRLNIDEMSLPVSWDNNSESLFDAIQYLAETSNYEWQLNWDGYWGFVFNFQRRIGADKSRKIILYEGRDILSASFAYTLEGMANSIVASGTRSYDGNRPLTITVNDWESITKYGKIQQKIDYYGILSKATLYSASRMDLAHKSTPMSGISLEIPITTWAENRVRLGDTITVVVNEFSRFIPARINAYSIDSSGVVSVTADEQQDAMINESFQ